MPRNRLIVDTDGGVDDAQALLLLIAAGRPPDAITTVFGNVDLEAATQNVLATLAVAGVDIPVHKGAAAPLAQEEVIHARHVHWRGWSGRRPAARHDGRHCGHGCRRISCLNLARGGSGGDQVDLLTIGPLTNLAMAIAEDAGAIRGIGRLTVMGGTVYGRGNATPAAEFNIFADPEAAAAVFAADIDTVVVPWEPCVTHFLAGPEIDRLFEAIADSDYKVFSQSLAWHAPRR